jgi:hypothetical protein
MLIGDYIISVFIAKFLNIYKIPMSSFSLWYIDITWEIFIFMILIVVEVIIIEHIYKKFN